MSLLRGRVQESRPAANLLRQGVQAKAARLPDGDTFTGQGKERVAELVETVEHHQAAQVAADIPEPDPDTVDQAERVEPVPPRPVDILAVVEDLEGQGKSPEEILNVVQALKAENGEETET